MADLSGLEIAVTRPVAQAEDWCQALQHLGARTHRVPLLEIVPVADPAAVQAVKSTVLALADYRIVVFVSRNAVQQAMDWIDQYWPQLPVGIRYFAVGSATAQAARDRGLAVEAAGQAMNSEALLDLPGLQSVKGEKVLICRGAGGRPYLGEQLHRRGAGVDYCELYQRRLPVDAERAFRQLMAAWQPSKSSAQTAAHSPPRKVVAVHSGESLQNLRQLMDDTGNSALENALLLVPGARVAQLAAQLGFRRLLVAENATDEAMTRALFDGI